MNQTQNTAPLSLLAPEVTEQHAYKTQSDPLPGSALVSFSATDYTPFVLALAVFVVILRGYQR